MVDFATQSKRQLFAHGEADLCVACGLCLPLCPTYRLTRTENESPRGRLSLMRGLATGQITADTHLVQHLDRCTLCLACEKSCPAGVGFGAQMSRTRSWLADQGLKPKSLIETFLLNTLRTGNKRIRQFGWAARTYQRNPIRKILRGSGLLRATGLNRADAALPAFSQGTQFDASYPAINPKMGPSTGPEKAEIALFTGCLQDQTDPETLPATIKLLNHLGYTVAVPPDQGCCGGLHLHSGDSKEAQTLALKNTNALAQARRIVSVASGCGAVLQNYEHILGPEGKDLAGKFRDIGTLLIEEHALNAISFNSLAATALVHEPCSHRNQLNQSHSTYEILQNIPELTVSPLAGNEVCCGGAGTYALSQPDLANRMREPKLAELAKMKPDYLVTTNIGCALHLKSGLAEYKIDVEIVHPVTLLARQIVSVALKTQESCVQPATPDMV